MSAIWQPTDTSHKAATAPAHDVQVVAGTTSEELTEFISSSFGSLSFTNIFSCGTAREKTPVPPFPGVGSFQLMFTIFEMFFDLIRQVFDFLTVTFRAVLCPQGPGGRAQVVTGTVDCQLTDAGLECPFDLGAFSQLTITGSLPMPAELAGKPVEFGSTLSQVDPETGELTPLATQEGTLQVPRRTVLSASLAPVPRGLSWVAHRDVVAYRLKVRNTGVVGADRVRACMKVDKESEIVAAKGADLRGRRACWTLPTLRKGESVSRKLTLVTPTRGTSMKVVATLTPQKRQADPVRLETRLPVR